MYSADQWTTLWTLCICYFNLDEDVNIKLKNVSFKHFLSKVLIFLLLKMCKVWKCFTIPKLRNSRFGHLYGIDWFVNAVEMFIDILEHYIFSKRMLLNLQSAFNREQIYLIWCDDECYRRTNDRRFHGYLMQKCKII